MTTIILGGGGLGTTFDGVQVPKSECDVTDIAAIRKTLATHKPDVVILTAGVSNPATMDQAFYEEELAVNLGGAFNVAQASIWAGVEKLIFIASIAGLYGKGNHAAYSASKAGVISLVQSLAQEGQIQAFAISPGRCHTPLREKDYPGEDVRTRLQPSHINAIVQDILADRYESGDNIVIRMSGHDVLPIEIDRNLYWKKSLKIGEPVVC